MNFSKYLNEFNIEKGDLKELDNLLVMEGENGNLVIHRQSMIDILDRLGESGDLHGIDWSIMHGLESMDGHNEAIINNWKPTYWRKLMLRRIRNSGVETIGEKSLVEYLGQDSDD